jgi:hypothetical protein
VTRGPLGTETNRHIDVNDGTLQRTLGRKSGVEGHRSHHRPSQRGHTHRHTAVPKHRIAAKILILHNQKVARLLHTVAVLKFRRENLKIVAETIDEMRDQMRKGDPPERSVWSKLFDRLFAVVETGDINEILRKARDETKKYIQEHVALTAKNPIQGIAYIKEKREKGNEYLKEMAEIYSNANEINQRVAEGDRRRDFVVVAEIKYVKLAMDITVSFLSMVIPSHTATGIEFVYECITESDIPEKLTDLKMPDMVGFWNGAKDFWREEREYIVDAAMKMTLPEYAKHLREEAEKDAEEEIEKLFEKLGMKPEKNIEESIALLERLAKSAERDVFRDWVHAPMEKWLRLRKTEGILKAAVKSTWRKKLFKGVCWAFFLQQSAGKINEFREFLEEGPEGLR